ncbi:unnamed protein product [Closterium sp. NIES-64]|nr:unnamed protein product [Closterium sp. NIES-64]CAI6007394.1 unnamed protein product [Closterium sp. NIES-65]
MPRLYHRSQLALHIKRAICAHHVAHPLLRHVDLARWCFTRFGVRPDRSTIGRVLKGVVRWRIPDDAVDAIRVRGGAYPDMERAMARWIANAGPAGVPLTLATIRDHVATMARANGVPATFRVSIGWVRRALRRQGVRCMSAVSEAADQDMNAVRTAREKLPQLLMQLGVRPRDTFNFDETVLFISVLPRKTYGTGRSAGRKAPKERLTVVFLVNAEGSHAFRPLVISKAKRPHDFRPDYNPEELCYWRNTAKGWMTSSLFTHYIEQLDATMNAEDRHIVVLLDNASSHNLTTEGAVTEDLFGFRTRALKNVRLVFMPPNTTCFIQPLDQGLIAMAKARYRQHWLRAFTGMWTAEGATSAAARFKPNLRLVLEWLHDAWMNIPRSTIQRCWWRTGCLPRAWAMELPHVEPGVGGGPTAGGDIGLDDDVNDVGSLIDRLGLGPSAMPAQEFVGIDANQPTCAEPGEDPLAIEPRSEPTAEMWEAPASTQVVYDDSNPVTREARRTARAACEMLIGYARATCITPRDLCALFDIRNPIIVARMERASPALNLNASPPPAMSHEDMPPAETPCRRGRVLPPWITVPTPDWVAQSARRQELIDAGAPAVMSGYLAAAEWMRL